MDVFEFLQPKQKQLCQMLAKGKTPRQIGITLKMHPKSVYRVLKQSQEILFGETPNQQNTTKLALYCIKHGLVKPEEIEL